MFDWDHLKKANSGYFFHAFVAVKYSFLGLAVFVLGIIHAFFPFMFGFSPYRLAKIITDGTEKYFPKCVDPSTDRR